MPDSDARSLSDTPLSPVQRLSSLVRLLIAGAGVAFFVTGLFHPDCSRQFLVVGTAGKGRVVERRIRSGGKTRSYYVYLPAVADSAARLPVLVYLHGRGEDGDFWRIAGHLGAELREHPERFPCIIVFPHCPIPRYWIGPMARYAVEAMNQSVREFHGDPGRRLASGVSMGGYGSLICAVDNPGIFAAVAPVCGGVIPPVRFTPGQQRQLSPACSRVLDAQDPYAALAAALGKTPVWLFHGSEDDMVPVAESRRIASALKAAGGNVSYTELRDMGHDIGHAAYSDTGFLAWLFHSGSEWH
jgi:predicted peptidase